MQDGWKKRAHAKYMREWRKQHPEYRKKQQEHFKKFHEQNPDYANNYNRKWRAEHPEKVKQQTKRYIQRHPHRNEKNPEKLRAWRRARYLKKESFCMMCESTENLEVHHLDYANDTIITLCRLCHKFLHKGGVKKSES